MCAECDAYVPMLHEELRRLARPGRRPDVRALPRQCNRAVRRGETVEPCGGAAVWWDTEHNPRRARCAWQRR